MKQMVFGGGGGDMRVSAKSGAVRSRVGDVLVAARLVVGCACSS